MSHEWHAGVLNASSWHGLEEVGTMPDADAMIDAGERTCAWPVSLDMDGVQTMNGVACNGYRAVMGNYRDAVRRALGVVGKRYHATTPDSWRELVRAATLAGGKPTGAFALQGGSRMVATFEVGQSNGLRTNLLLADAFDGSMRLTVGFTAIRVVCANTLAASLSSDGKGMAALRHTASLDSKVKGLQTAIAASIESGEQLRTSFANASDVYLHKDAFKAAFDTLFPEAPEDATAAQKTKLHNIRIEAIQAGKLPINRVGDKPGNLATLWNAATYLVDRTATGAHRDTRGESTSLDSMLFGTRGERVEQIREVMIEVLNRTGGSQIVPASAALDMGADHRQVGAKILEAMLES